MIARILSFGLMIWALGFAIFVVALPGPAPDGTTDGIVVLTGGPGRIQRGFALLQADSAKRMLVSGADRRVRPHELAVTFAVSPKLVEARVDLGREAVDTRSNAEETAAWVRRNHYRSIRIVTTDWHMPRARYEIGRMLDRNVMIISDGVESEPGLWALLKEYNKYLLRRAAAPFGI